MQGGAAQSQYNPNSYTKPAYDPASYTDGSAAVDMYSNPYLSGQTAGAIDQNSQYQAPYDPNAPQG